MRYTFHNLKVLTKAEMTNQNLDHLYIDDGFYSLETLKDAIHTQVSNELLKALWTVYEKYVIILKSLPFFRN